MQIILAPMHGISDLLFRNVLAELKTAIDGAVAPFIVPQSRIKSGKSLLKGLFPEENKIPVIPQILGNCPVSFKAIVQKLQEIGHTQVNWNLGCPYPMVIKKQRGAAWLNQPDKIEAFLQQTVEECELEVSIKLRIGLNDKYDILELLPILNKFKLKRLIIHPRTARQMYEGQTHLDIFARCLQQSTNPIGYNGDIFSREDFYRIQHEFPELDYFMLGRGLIRNPFLAWNIKNECRELKVNWEQLKLFHDRLLAAYEQNMSGPGHVLNKIKEIWEYLAVNFDQGDLLLKKIRKIKKLEKYKLFIGEI